MAVADRDNVQPNRAVGVVVIVLTHPSAPVPTRLMQSLQRRATEVRLVTDTPGVMAELAFANKAVLIVNQAHRFAGLDRLLLAVARYYPATDCWRFDESVSGGRPQLTRLELPSTEAVSTGSVAASATSDARPQQAPQTDEGPRLRIAGDETVGREEEDAPPLLTAEELAMLLGHADVPPRDAASS